MPAGHHPGELRIVERAGGGLVAQQQVAAVHADGGYHHGGPVSRRADGEARALEAEIARLAEGHPHAAGILGVDLGQPAVQGRFVERKIEGRGRGCEALQVLGEEWIARARLET